MKSLGVSSRTSYTVNGAETIILAKQLVENALQNNKKGVLRPIAFMFLDYQMPIKNGIQVVKEVTEFYKHQKTQLAN